jgi:hypothetical protein
LLISVTFATNTKRTTKKKISEASAPVTFFRLCVFYSPTCLHVNLKSSFLFVGWFCVCVLREGSFAFFCFLLRTANEPPPFPLPPPPHVHAKRPLFSSPCSPCPAPAVFARCLHFLFFFLSLFSRAKACSFCLFLCFVYLYLMEGFFSCAWLFHLSYLFFIYLYALHKRRLL